MSQTVSVRVAAPGQSSSQTVKGALAAAVATIILTAPILGLQLTLDGYQVVLQQHWRPVWIAAAVVFVFQLVKPMFVRATSHVRLPRAPALGARQQRVAIWVLLAFGAVFPFLGSRGSIDVATLALVYVILGLGLNIVVGFGMLEMPSGPPVMLVRLLSSRRMISPKPSVTMAR